MADDDIDVRIARELQSNGDVLVGYSVDTHPCMHVKLETAVARKAAKLQVVIKELEFCEASIAFALASYKDKDGMIVFKLEDSTQVSLRALHVAAVVTYAKCFMNPGKGRTRLDQTKIFKDDESGLAAFHQWIMEAQRHEYIAHANETELEETGIYLLMMPPSYSSEWRFVLSHTNFQAAPPPSVLNDFLFLIRYVKSWVIKQAQSITDHIYHEAKKESLAAYYQRASYGRVTPCPPPPPRVRQDAVPSQE